jgi:hypothetical protein
MRRSLLTMLAVWLLVIAAIAVGLHGYQNVQAAARARQFKDGLHAIQLALERYSVNLGVTPEDVRQIIARGYLPSFPPNPYSGQPMQPRELPAIPVTLGDFSYLPARVIEDHLDAPTSWSPSGYYLLGYGADTQHEDAYLHSHGFSGITVILGACDSVYVHRGVKGEALGGSTEPLEQALARYTGYAVPRKSAASR